MKHCTLTTFNSVLEERYGGLIASGKHREGNNEACALEIQSVCLGIDFTDDPDTLRTWDLRVINDMHVSRELRAKWMPPLVAAYAGCLDWPIERQVRVAFGIAIRTVQRLISELPYLSDKLRTRCREISGLEDGRPLLQEIAMGLEATQKKMRVEEARAVERSVAAVREMKRSVERVEDVRLMVETAWSPAAAAEAAWEVETAAIEDTMKSASEAAAKASAETAVCAAWSLAAASRVSEETAVETAIVVASMIFPATCQLWLDAAEVNWPFSD
ncbi:MAG: hypothetical protein ACRD98_00285 [Nitrososphaera sp.]